MPRHWSDNWEADDAGPIRCSGHAIVRRVVGREDGREGALKILTDDAQNRRERRFRLKEEVNALVASSCPAAMDLMWRAAYTAAA